MPSNRPRTMVFAAAALAAGALCSAWPVLAQCSTVGISPTSAGMTTSNPVQAVLVTSFLPPRDPKLPQPLILKPQAFARDSQGRIRLDRIFGTVHMETGPDAGSDIEMHGITICDPVKNQVIQLNNVNRTATVRPLRLLAARSTATAAPFCRVPSSAKPSTDVTIVDLGHRTIEGFDAIGWRITRHVPLPNTTPDATLQRISETWCSEDLGAVVLSILSGSEDGPKTELAMTQIQRGEPDPSLFDIPPDYTVSETVQPSRFIGSAVQ
jgi:hypothetical protein